jgi:hypothetical protein
VKLSSNAWLQKPGTSDTNKIMKENGNVKSVMPSGHLPHATLTLSSWKSWPQGIYYTLR